MVMCSSFAITDIRNTHQWLLNMHRHLVAILYSVDFIEAQPCHGCSSKSSGRDRHKGAPGTRQSDWFVAFGTSVDPEHPSHIAGYLSLIITCALSEMIYAATSYSAKPMFMYVPPTAELETALDYQVTDNK